MVNLSNQLHNFRPKYIQYTYILYYLMLLCYKCVVSIAAHGKFNVEKHTYTYVAYYHNSENFAVTKNSLVACNDENNFTTE